MTQSGVQRYKHQFDLDGLTFIPSFRSQLEIADIQKNGLPAGVDRFLESPADALEALVDPKVAAGMKRSDAVREILKIQNPNFDPKLKDYAMEKQLREGVDAIAAKPSLDLTADGEKYFKDQLDRNKILFS